MESNRWFLGAVTGDLAVGGNKQSSSLTDVNLMLLLIIFMLLLARSSNLVDML